MTRRRGMVAVILAVLVAANVFSPVRPRLAAIELRPEVLWSIGSFRITNTLVTAWLTIAVLAVLAWRSTRHLVDAPAGRSLQNAVEALFETIYGLMQGFGGALSRVFFPVTVSLFLYILVANWLSLVPGMGSIGLWRAHAGGRQWIPLVRAATTDLNTTVALATCSVLLSQYFGMRLRGGLRYLERFVPVSAFKEFARLAVLRRQFRFRLVAKGMLELFVGALEVFDELTKILSFSFRLFGNMFGSEVLLAVIAFLAPYVASVPFIALEVLGGFIQAFIFAALSTAFFARAAGEASSAGPSEPVSLGNASSS